MMKDTDALSLVKKGLIPTDTRSGVNIDNETNPSTFLSVGDSHGFPSSDSWWFVEVISHYRSGAYVTQKITGWTTGYVYMRSKSDSGWKPWQRIDNFGYNSLADLAGGVAEALGAHRTTVTNDGLYKCSEPAKLYRSLLYELCGRSGGNSQILHLYVASQDSKISIVKGAANANSYENCFVKIYKDDEGYVYIKGNASYNVAVRSCYTNGYFYKVTDVDETQLSEITWS